MLSRGLGLIAGLDLAGGCWSSPKPRNVLARSMDAKEYWAGKPPAGSV